jgi:hypothetical protein
LEYLDDLLGNVSGDNNEDDNAGSNLEYDDDGSVLFTTTDDIDKDDL